jgi:hypothetical protein
MEAKYYTPEFHEFHYGFEYEDGFFNAHFTPKSFDFKDVEGGLRSLFLKSLDNKQIRVKCLDKEDIESLGWELDTVVKSDTFYIHKTSNLQNGTFRLTFREKENTIEINSIEYSFYGKIKNKSELKRLMIQTEILK